MAFTRSGVRLPLAPPPASRANARQAAQPGAFLLPIWLLTNAVNALHDAKKPEAPNARQDSARGAFRHRTDIGRFSRVRLPCLEGLELSTTRHPGNPSRRNGQTWDRNDDPVVKCTGDSSDSRCKKSDRDRQASQ